MRLPALASHPAGHTDWVLDLQRQSGNAAVRSLLQGASGPAAQRQAVGAAPPGEANADAGNPVVGLKRGDGLNFGTQNLKGRVSILQSKLNEKMAAGLDPDGKFGALTGRALQDFQESVGQARVEAVNKETGDLLMDRNKVEPVPPPDNQFNEALEFRLDSVALEYVKTLRAQESALVNLERDLRVEEKAPVPLSAERVALFLLEKAVTFVIESLLGGFAKVGELRKVVVTAFFSESEAKDPGVGASIVEFGIDLVFEEIRDKLVGGAKSELASKRPEQGSLELFIDAQRKGIFDATEGVLEKFSTDVKPRMRKLMPGLADRQQDPANYRVERAQDLHVAVREGSAKTFEKQYFTSLRQYAAYRAQSDLDPKGMQDENQPREAGTDMLKLQEKDNTSSGVRGILEIHIPDVEDENARKPITIQELHISGLAARARENINRNHSGMTIGELGLPRRMWDGNDSGLFPPRIDDVEVMVGRNERGGPATLIKSDGPGQRWLMVRGGGSLDAGVTAAMDEVDRKTIAEVESKKGIEEPG